MAVLRTSCDKITGALKYGVQGNHPLHSHLGDLVHAFLGDTLLREMERASSQACTANDPDSGFFFESQSSRGGWRGLFIAISSPLFEEDKQASEARRLVQR